MKQKGFLLAAGFALFSAVSAPASQYRLANGQKDFYYGHISFAEIKNDGQDPVVFREGRLTRRSPSSTSPLVQETSSRPQQKGARRFSSTTEPSSASTSTPG